MIRSATPPTWSSDEIKSAATEINQRLETAANIGIGIEGHRNAILRKAASGQISIDELDDFVTKNAKDRLEIEQGLAYASCFLQKMALKHRLHSEGKEQAEQLRAQADQRAEKLRKSLADADLSQSQIEGAIQTDEQIQTLHREAKHAKNAYVDFVPRIESEWFSAFQKKVRLRLGMPLVRGDHQQIPDLEPGKDIPLPDIESD